MHTSIFNCWNAFYFFMKNNISTLLIFFLSTVQFCLILLNKENITDFSLLKSWSLRRTWLCIWLLPKALLGLRWTFGWIGIGFYTDFITLQVFLRDVSQENWAIKQTPGSIRSLLWIHLSIWVFKEKNMKSQNKPFYFNVKLP